MRAVEVLRDMKPLFLHYDRNGELDMKEEIRQFLMENSEEKYREFSKALIPGEETMLGVRLPVLRKRQKS